MSQRSSGWAPAIRPGSSSPAPAVPRGARDDGPMRDVEIDTDMIRLGPLLKLAGAMDSGGASKTRIAAGEVLVNGAVETRRGRQLHRGDVVSVDGERYRVA